MKAFVQYSPFALAFFYSELKVSQQGKIFFIFEFLEIA